VGTMLYVKELDNLAIPGTNMKHNGCVRVDDNGWSFNGCQLDWFVATYNNYKTLSIPDQLTAQKETCTPLKY